MTNLNYNGQSIEQRNDGYVNATSMAKANDVRVNNWLQLESTKHYIQELSLFTGIPVNQIKVVKSGDPKMVVVHGYIHYLLLILVVGLILSLLFGAISTLKH